jgi:hypothetical protein
MEGIHGLPAGYVGEVMTRSGRRPVRPGDRWLPLAAPCTDFSPYSPDLSSGGREACLLRLDTRTQMSHTGT